MSEPASQPTTHYCFHCGHKVDPTRESCWYCGARLRRLIRPPKKCPFCGSMIPSEAVKCRHCGEFVDGRPVASQAAPLQQIVFVIDRALLGDARGGAYRLLPGRPVPADIARQLSAPTVRAIETNQPRLLDDPRVRALPAPGGDDADAYAGGGVIDVQAEASREVVRAGGSGGRDGSLPTRRENLAGAPRGGFGGMLATIGRFLMRTAPGARPRPRPVDDAIDVKPEERYRACVKCGTEILAADNFCYHCGAQYHKAKVDLGGPLEAKRRGGSNVALHGLAAMACLALGAVHAGWIDLPVKGVIGVVAVGVLAGVIAFFRRRAFFNQLVSVALGLGVAALGILALIKH
jgi:hypothetical protein